MFLLSLLAAVPDVVGLALHQGSMHGMAHFAPAASAAPVGGCPQPGSRHHQDIQVSDAADVDERCTGRGNRHLLPLPTTGGKAHSLLATSPLLETVSSEDIPTVR